MGRKEWHSWGAAGKTSKKDGGSGGGRGGEKDKESGSGASLPSGCMCAVFQIFDFHQFQFPLNHQHQVEQEQDDDDQSTSASHHQLESSFLPPEDPHPISKGVEAPRNSLELEEEPSSSENFNLPMGSIQIKTNGISSSSGPNDSNSSSSEISSSSPGIKTPNLVARLMGLDLLPDQDHSSPAATHSSPLPNSTRNLNLNLPPKSHLHLHFRPQQSSLQSRRNGYRSSSPDADFSGTRSLPETPRISSARRSDVDQHGRFSLQVNKENVSDQELVLSHHHGLKRRSDQLKVEEEEEDQSRSPGFYARQIVKQVKESVSRKVGLVDITNTVLRKRDQQQQTATRRRDQELEPDLVSPYNNSKNKVVSKALSSRISDVASGNNVPGKHTSSRLNKFLEPKHKPITTTPKPSPLSSSSSSSSQINFLSQINRTASRPDLPQVQDQQYHHHHHHQQQQQQQRPQAFKKCKKMMTEEKFGPPPPSRFIRKTLKTSDIIRHKQKEPFVIPSTATKTTINPDKKSKKTTPISSNDLQHITTLLPVKKDPTPPATKIPQKQVSQDSKWSSQLSSCLNQSYKQPQTTRRLEIREANKEDRSSNNGVITTNIMITTGDRGAAEYEYITRILQLTGINKDTPVLSFTRWFSPSHPLDPSSFYYLEYFPTATLDSTTTCHTLDRRCDRRLLFDLVDEILVEFLQPPIDIKSWSSFCHHGRIGSMDGSHLVRMLCMKIRSFPHSDCRDLEDIDGLIEKDLPDIHELKDQNEVAFGEEGERIVTEIEKEIVDTLIHETMKVLL